MRSYFPRYRYEGTGFTSKHMMTMGLDSVRTKYKVENDEISGVSSPGGGGKTTIPVILWDTAGQERYQSLGTAFYRGADCCLLVYDITNPQSFENLANWKQTFLSKGMMTMPETFPFIVVGNKLDMQDDNR